MVTNSNNLNGSISSATQFNIFGGEDTVSTKLDPHQLPKAMNDWAFCVQILLLYNRPVDFFTIVKEFGVIKFQTRAAEIAKVYPDLVEVSEGPSLKRLGRTVLVSRYFIRDKSKGVDLYMSVFNKKAEFSRLLHGKKTK